MSTDRMRPARAIACIALAMLVGACASTQTVVLLPERDGAQTAVTVKDSRGREVVLDKPYAAVKETAFGPRAYVATPQEVRATFGSALAAQPIAPASFTLYFIENRDELSDESKAIVDKVFDEIARRPVPDVVVIGHTDSVGSDQTNDTLARQRAETVRAQLIRRGVPADNIQAIGRGKRELLVPTADNVAEPRNRRVEILVR